MHLPEFLKAPSVWLYLFVFFGKILEVAVSTVRIVLINRGERLKGSITGFFEVSLWLIVTGTVLAGFQEDLLRCIESYLEGKICADELAEFRIDLSPPDSDLLDTR